ncbi:MAG TPA: efflux RND transporter periplasmic adaptor subunit [Candidatus Binatia bacterium]|jgi:multidrug efflux system membrane fusion protein|nr:efflux RND transporter periplasmic adaptor subunit [Candidatus Binatia bacterium]
MFKTVDSCEGTPGQRAVLSVIIMLALALAGCKQRSSESTGPPGRPGGGGGPVPVVPGVVERKDVPIYLEGLGTVQAFNTVTIRSRVDGQIQHIAFIEGQDVRTNDLLAQIDPAPFQAQLDQNLAKKAQDEAQLAVARITLARDKELLASKILAQQDYDTQQATVDQLAAGVQGDQAAIDNGRVQLAYTSITSPLDGRTGIRQVDQGNIVHATDASGIVVITQVRPISLVFTLPEQNLGQIQEHLRAGETLTTFALARDNRTSLGEGKLAVIDNEIDTSTGTIRLKATFANEDLKLWPGQFVNARLLLTTRKGGTVVPASVVQRGPDGTFAYVIAQDLTAQVRPIKVALIEQNQALIDEGLVPGERVVVDGQYKLQPGAKVKLPGAEPGAGNQKPGVRGPLAEDGRQGSGGGDNSKAEPPSPKQNQYQNAN